MTYKKYLRLARDFFSGKELKEIELKLWEVRENKIRLENRWLQILKDYL